MRGILLRVCIAGLLVGVAAGQSPTDKPDGTPTVADVAAKQKKPKAKHVFTNEDIPERAPDTGGSATSSTGTTSAAASGSAAAGADTKAKSKDKSAQSADKAAQAEAVKAAQAKVDVLKKDEDGLTTVVQHIEKLIAEGGEFRRANMSDGLQKQQGDLAEAKKKREAAEQDLRDLQSPPK